MIGIDDVLDFWFVGDLSSARDVWFNREDAFDAGCVRLREAHEAAKSGALDDWAETPQGALALLILLDQIPRNLYRGSAEAFAADPKARAIADKAIARGFDKEVPENARGFFYLPFEHSENLADQCRAVALFSPLGEVVKYAEEHRELIRRFGRFPHRNAALGRISTPEEEAYLTQADAKLG